MPDLGLITIGVEGAVDKFLGRPRNANPYSYENARQWFEAWLLGWDDADWLLSIRGEEEARRWLGNTAA